MNRGPAGGVAVIIPTWNEEESLPLLLGDLARQGAGEIVVVDGESGDRTVEAALRAGASVLSSARCRGLQLNAGAAYSHAETLLFLHADSRLPDGALAAVHASTMDEGLIMGAFRLHIERVPCSPVERFSLAIIELMANLRSRRLSLPYGDQGFFLKRRRFDQLGGFRELHRCEDLDLALRARAAGRIAIAKLAITTSARRWLAEGPWTRTLRNWKEACSFVLDSRPEREVGNRAVADR